VTAAESSLEVHAVATSWKTFRSQVGGHLRAPLARLWLARAREKFGFGI